jgi:hypothetical protein
MSDEVESSDAPSDDDIARVEALFARADATLWAEAPPSTEAAIMAAIVDHESDAADGADAPQRRLGMKFGATAWLATAAALVVVVTGVALITRGGGDEAAVFALSGTERAPDASAEVEMSETPVGVKILLTPDALPPAPDGTYYECWLSDGEVKVSAGTFHLQGGTGQIELWAGTTGPEFDRLAVTLEPLDDDLDSSGDVYLSGTFDPNG